MKHSHTLARLGAVAAVAALALTGCGTTESTGGDTGGSDSASAACDLKIGYMGPLTGDYANLGQNMLGGVKVALDEYNTEHADCQVTLEEYDSQGDPEKATPLATQVVQDDKVIGLVGPSFSGETEATGPAFAEAGLVTVSPSATNPALSTNGWDTFHRVLGNDAAQAPAAAQYISGTVGSTKVFVIDDASEYGKGIADGVADTLGGSVIDRDTVQQKQTDFSATVTKVKASGADAVFYGGYYPEAGLMAKQLRAAGWKGAFVSGDGSLDPGFVEAAGAKGGEGAVLTCPCAPNPAAFSAKYKELNGSDPGTYSAEAYDAANVLLQGIGAGNEDRASLLDWVNNYDADGITKHIKFDSGGEVSTVTVYAYVVKGGVIEPGTPIE
ncbi:MAG: branched-chain amino acid ABC transporter substrate-binding protein [Nocardioides sp.]